MRNDETALPAGVLAGVLLLSVAMLAFQILQATTLGLQLFPEAGFLVVSLSMLGLGSGGSFATLRSRRGPDPSPARTMYNSALGFAVTAVLASVLSSRSHAIGPIVLVCAVPYVCVGLFLASAFAANPAKATVTYCVDLVGAALGCVLIVLLLDGVGDAGLVCLLVGAMGALAAAAIGWTRGARQAAGAVAVALAILALAPARHDLFRFGPEPLKFYGKLLAKGAAGGHLERQQWNHMGRLDVVAPGPAIAEFDFTKDVTRLLDAGCRFLLLYSNGYNWTYVVDFGDETTLRRAYFERWAQHLPYAFVAQRPDVLNLGAGGGVDMYIAALHDARSIVGVEINPLMIAAARDWHPTAWAGLWNRSGTSMVALDARTFVDTTNERFDVVTLNAVDTAGTQASLLSANFLYTTDAFAAYLRVLRPGGAIFLTRPREQLLRTLTAAVSALRSRGAVHPERHIAVVGKDELLSATIFVEPLADERVASLRERLGRGDFTGTAQYLPGVDVGGNDFVAYFAAVASGRDDAYLATTPRLVTPTTDDRPYFYQLERDFLRSGAGRLLRTILFVVLGIGAVLMFLPLLGLRLPHKGPVVVANLVYFACLGTGFMLAEIGLLTKLGLFLGHPARSLTVTLAVLLLSSGVGSILAGRLAASRRLLPAALGAVVVLLLAAGPVLEALGTATVREAPARIAIVVALLTPLGVALGMPFPLRLRALGGVLEPLVPWTWAVNGFASVAGSVLAVALAMNLGFRAVFVIAATCYAAAFLTVRIGPRSPSAN